MPATIRSCVEATAARFANADLYYGHGTDNAHDEAVYLVFAALDLPFDCSESALDKPLDAAVETRIQELVRQRIEERRPTAYLVNQAWFCGLSFYIDERVLVPRSPIAELIETGFTPWLDPAAVGSVLDVGTGSGCIAIACAYAFPNARIDAIDNQPAALAVAQRNIDAHNLGARVNAIESDLFTELADRRYDLVIANPPYVDAADMAALPPEYRHEPAPALAAGVDGLAVVERLLDEVTGYLSAGGILVIEVGNSRAALERARPELPMLWLEFERGGSGVCLLEAGALAASR